MCIVMAGGGDSMNQHQETFVVLLQGERNYSCVLCRQVVGEIL